VAEWLIAYDLPDDHVAKELWMDLRELRKERGLSLEALGYLAGVDQATISRIERGLAEPRRDTVVRLARALRIGAKRMAEIMAESQEFDEYAAKENVS
jgi:transcriptional regulator with XRE-family HTH domain